READEPVVTGAAVQPVRLCSPPDDLATRRADDVGGERRPGGERCNRYRDELPQRDAPPKRPVIDRVGAHDDLLRCTARGRARSLRERVAETANEPLTGVHHPTKRSPPAGSWNKVSCRPAGASSRELMEPHGVVVGSASTVAPASASVCVLTAASSTSNATRMCPATREPTSTSSMYSACSGSDSSSVARPASRIVTRPCSPVNAP